MKIGNIQLLQWVNYNIFIFIFTSAFLPLPAHSQPPSGPWTRDWWVREREEVGECVWGRESECMGEWVSVCVCERERESERE